MLCFYENIRRSNFFCGYILTECVFVTKLSCNVEISGKKITVS